MMTKQLSDEELQGIADKTFDRMLENFGGDINNVPPEEGGIILGGKKRESKSTSESETTQHQRRNTP